MNLRLALERVVFHLRVVLHLHCQLRLVLHLLLHLLLHLVRVGVAVRVRVGVRPYLCPIVLAWEPGDAAKAAKCFRRCVSAAAAALARRTG